ncbi:MAG: UDP-N-acetylglucosamine 2-epimerase (non-hydrolyzing) [Vicingaceae bacterium]
MKVVTIVGARPQFVKAAVVSRALKALEVDEVIIHTGQHFDTNMSAVFFEEMQIPKPSFNLDIHGVNHGAMTGRMLEKIEEIILDEKPDVLLVYGDTNSTLAGALAAKKLHIPVAHVEAGLRSFNMQMPEEVNRILTDRISDILYTPTEQAGKNLKAEGYDNFGIKIECVGDVMLDAALFYAAQLKDKKPTEEFFLCTLHRAENTDDLDRLRALIEGLNEIHKETKVILPLHPRTKAVIDKNNLNIEVETIEPMGYLEMIEKLENCIGVITDSGGLQKEAFFFKKPCITMRDQTEWVELVNHGFNVLVGANKEQLVDEAKAVKHKNLNFDKSLYGEGDAGMKIAKSLKNHFG